MNKLINVILTLMIWLTLFEPNLIKPLMIAPADVVMGSLTVIDYLLLALTGVIVFALMKQYDKFLALRRHRKAQ